MPRVYLTDAQRREAAAQKAEKQQRQAVEGMYRKLADGLAVKKNRENLRNEDLGELFGVTRQTMARVLKCENVQLPVETVMKIIFALGLEVTEQ